MAKELPAMAASFLTATSYSPMGDFTTWGDGSNVTTGGYVTTDSSGTGYYSHRESLWPFGDHQNDGYRERGNQAIIDYLEANRTLLNEDKDKDMADPKRRIVQVFIADPDENVPLADSLLYKGEQKLTDLTDEELFFEIDLKGVLDLHNEKRESIVNKKVKERTEYLEHVRIRDLKMTVVTIAAF